MSSYASYHKKPPLRTRHSPERTDSLVSISPASSPGRSITPPSAAPSPSSSTFLAGSVSSLWGGLMRRFSSEPTATPPPPLPHARTFQPDGEGKHGLHGYMVGNGNGNGIDGVYTPPAVSRTASPMRPPPLEPVQLVGFSDETRQEERLLTGAVAEEIRIMVPARLGIVDEWRLVYSLEQDGASLATLYEKCGRFAGRRVGFVLVVKDLEGGLFGAYLSDPPHPAPKYFGTGECFLWRASVLSPLPPPPSAIDATTTTSTNIRTTTITSHNHHSSSSTTTASEKHPSRVGTPSSTSIRFKAFPYSGMNEYYMLCETHFLSLGAGDGKYGLWLDDSLERGVSSTSQTFGNEPLSDEGEKFGVLGVEVWVIGA
ncbi:hypothetical protein VTI74DRAFT_10021 [Chaetomium olivicolor]